MEPEQKTSGALIGSIVIIIILILGGIYLWRASMKARTLEENSSVGQSSDDTADVEASVNNVDFDGLDQGI